MGKGERFKLHGPEHGGRLEDQIALGDSNWARRFVTVREQAAAPKAERIERARVAVSKVGGVVGKRGRGRPRVIEGEPWAADGVSRKTWERRRKKEGGG
jgi:hypothetical protein